MINGLEGIPGSGKSYEGVVFHVLEALKQGRLVITNLPLNIDMFAALDPGYRDLIELRTRPAKQLPGQRKGPLRHRHRPQNPSR